MSEPRRCSECSAVLASDGSCPGCALGCALAVELAPPPVANSTPETKEWTTNQETSALEPKEASGDGNPFGLLQRSSSPESMGSFGEHEIRRLVGEGGMGVVFEAHDPKLRRTVAIKAMKPALADDEAARERFLREARAVAGIEHDNIVAVHQVGEDAGVPFLVMPFLRGIDLGHYLDANPVPPLERTLTLVAEVADGLDAAHQQGLIHRDIKPANIWLECPLSTDGEPDLADCRVKIVDFGLARSVRTDARVTAAGTVLGSPAYMAPEQARGHDVDARCDLFSLGCVLYRMCTGQLPFWGEDTFAVLTSLASDTPEDPRTLNSSLPDTVVDLISELLSKDPDRRPQSAATVAHRLREIRSGLDDTIRASIPRVSDDPTDPTLPLEQQQETSRRRTPRWLYAAALLLPLLLVLGWMYGVQVVRFATDRGELVIEIDDPNVEVRIVRGKAELIDRTTERTFVLGAGDGVVEVFEKDGVGPLLTEKFQLNRGGRAVVRVTLDRLTKAKTVAPPPKPGGTETPVRAPTWKRGPKETELVGLIPYPARFPNLGRWQLMQRSPSPAAVASVCYSPDGKWLACLSGLPLTHMGEVRIYDAKTLTLERLAFAVFASQGERELRWSPDSRWISLFQNVRLQLLEVGRSRASEISGRFAQVAWNPRRPILAAVGEVETANEVRLISDGGKKVTPLKGHTQRVLRLAWSADGTWLATASEDKTLRLWRADGAAGPVIADYSGNTGGFAWHPSESVLAFANAKGEVRAWAERSPPSWSVSLDGVEPARVAWSPDGSMIAAGGAKERLGVWTRDGKPLRTLVSKFTRFWWQPDSKGFLLRTGKTMTAVRLDGKEGTPFEVKGRLRSPLWEPMWNDDGSALVGFFATPRAPLVLTHRTGAKFQPKPFALDLNAHLFLVNDVAWHPDSTVFAVAFDSSKTGWGGVVLFDRDGKVVDDSLGTMPHLTACAVSPRGRLATGEALGQTTIWEGDGRKVCGLPALEPDISSGVALPPNAIVHLNWHPDGTHLAVCERVEKVHVWDVGEKSRLATLSVPSQHRVPCASFQPGSGKLLALSGQDKGALWEWQTERTPRNWFPIGTYDCLHWHPDGKRLLSLAGQKTDDKKTANWLTPTAEGVRREPVPLPNLSASVVFGPDGKQLCIEGTEGNEIVDARGTRIRALGVEGHPTDWSRDGDLIGYNRLGPSWLRSMGHHAKQAPIGPKLVRPTGEPGPTIESMFVNLAKDNTYTNHSEGPYFSNDGRWLYTTFANRLVISRADRGSLERIVFLLPEEEYAIVSAAGEILFASPKAEQQFVYALETREGKLELLSPERFRARVRAITPSR